MSLRIKSVLSVLTKNRGRQWWTCCSSTSTRLLVASVRTTATKKNIGPRAQKIYPEAEADEKEKKDAAEPALSAKKKGEMLNSVNQLKEWKQRSMSRLKEQSEIMRSKLYKGSTKKGIDDIGGKAMKLASAAEKEIMSFNWPEQWKNAKEAAYPLKIMVAATHAPLVIPAAYMILTVQFSPLIGQSNLLAGAVLLTMWGAARLSTLVAPEQKPDQVDVNQVIATTVGSWVAVILASPITDFALMGGHFYLASQDYKSKIYPKEFLGLRIIAVGLICASLFLNMLARWLLPNPSARYSYPPPNNSYPPKK